METHLLWWHEEAKLSPTLVSKTFRVESMETHLLWWREEAKLSLTLVSKTCRVGGERCRRREWEEKTSGDSLYGLVGA